MQQLFERARASFQGGRFSYAVELLRTILKQEPGCAGVRRVLHAVYREMHAKDSWMKRATCRLRTAIPLRTTVPSMFRKEQYPQLLEYLEDLQGLGAPAGPVLHWLHKIAETCHLPETGTVAVESLVVARPEDPAAWRIYVDHCRANDLHKRAIQGLRKLAKLRPFDVELQSERKQVTAADTVAEAGWEDGSSYRDNLRDEELAQRLEDEKRPEAMTSEDSLNRMVADARAAVERQSSVENLRRLGDLLRRSGDFDGALQQYEQASAQSGDLDPALDDSISACQRALSEIEIQRWRKYAAENEDKAQLAEERIRVLSEERDAKQLARLEDRVKRLPLEARYQLELGDLYLPAGRLDEALRCYQAARRGAAHAFAAGLGAGKCLAGKGLCDLAEKEFRNCLEKVSGRTDPRRLRVLYELFLLSKAMGKPEDGVPHLKEIYAVDAAYLDVGALLDEYVRQRDATPPPQLGAGAEMPT